MADEQCKCLQYSTSGIRREGSGSRYSRYVGGTYAGDGKMLPKFSRLMCEICLDFVKLFCDAFKWSTYRQILTILTYGASKERNNVGVSVVILSVINGYITRKAEKSMTKILVPKWDIWPLGFWAWVCVDPSQWCQLATNLSAYFTFLRLNIGFRRIWRITDELDRFWRFRHTVRARNEIT